MQVVGITRRAHGPTLAVDGAVGARHAAKAMSDGEPLFESITTMRLLELIDE